jgi:hypothetical protein
VVGVEAAHDLDERLDRVWGAENLVRRSHGDLRDEHRVNEIAEVEQPAQTHVAASGVRRHARVDHHVVVVRVAMDRHGAAAEPGSTYVQRSRTVSTSAGARGR